MYHVTIQFNLDQEQSFDSVGTNFSFMGLLTPENWIQYKGESFCIKSIEPDTVCIDFYVSEANACEGIGLDFKFTGYFNEMDQLDVTGKEFIIDIVKFDLNIRPLNEIPGVLCFSFRDNKVYDYCVSTFTHYVHDVCRNDWLNDLKGHVERLNITKLHVMGRNQKKMIQDHVGNVPIQIWPKPIHYMRICPKCGKFGCAQFKARKLLFDMFPCLFHCKCEE